MFTKIYTRTPRKVVSIGVSKYGGLATWKSFIGLFVIAAAFAISGIAWDGGTGLWDLPDSEGHAHRATEIQGKRAAVFEFVAIDCPISNRYVPEMARMSQEFEAKGIAFYAVLPRSSTLNQAKKYTRDFQYRFPVLLDSRNTLVRQLGVTVTPEVAVISPEGTLLYRGRIDDRHVDLGKERPHPVRRDLREALDAIVAGHHVTARFTKTIGCFIEGK